jgi:hypothetical protein
MNLNASRTILATLSITIFLLLLPAAAYSQEPIIELQVGQKLKVASLEQNGVKTFLGCFPAKINITNDSLIATEAGLCAVSVLTSENGETISISKTPIVLRVVDSVAPEVRRVAWPSTEGGQNTVVAAQWLEGFRFKRNLTGAWAEFEKVP